MKTKKLLTLVFALIFIFGAFPFGTLTASADTSGCLTYTVSNGEATITDCYTTVSGTVSIPSTLGGYPVTGIADEAFYCCVDLKNIVIPNSVESIGNSAFEHCESLKSVTIPNKVTSIDDYAFCSCESLASVTIPDSVTSIGKDAFYLTRSVTSVYITDIATWCNIEFANPYSNPLIGYSGANLYLNNTLVTDLVIPQGITKINDYAFQECNSIESLTIPNSVTSIDEWSFFGCNNLASVTLPDTIISIGNRAFFSCTNLEDITIPDGVESIGEYAFYSTAISSVIIPDSVENIGANAFNINIYDGTNMLYVKKCVIYCYKNSYASIYANDNDLSYVYIDGTDDESIFSGNIDEIGWTLDKRTGTLEITGEGAIPDFSTFKETPWNEHAYSVTNIIISDGITNIGERAFGEFGGVKEVVISDSVIGIGKYAFYGCISIKNIIIPDSVISIGALSFEGCTNLADITIPDSVTSIGFGAFYSCESFTSIIIPYSVTNIQINTFKECTNLTDVSIYNRNCEINDSCGLNDTHTVYGFVGSTAESFAQEIIGATFIDVNTVHTHTFKAATCTLPKKCTVCGKTEGNKLSHSFENACDIDCNGCGKIRNITHDYEWVVDTEPTCVDEGAKHEKCTVCSTVRSENTSIPVAENHSYTNDIDNDCNVCGFVRTITYTGWWQKNSKWMYYENGVIVTDRWIEDSKGLVYIGLDGYMVTNEWHKDSVGWCYVGPDGYCLTNCWQKDSVGWCYLDENGRITINKWIREGGNWFYVGNNGYRVTKTWVEYNGKLYYLNEQGIMQTGWLRLDNARYYLNSDGDAQIGWATIEGIKYLFDDKGKCVEGAHKFVIDISRWQGNIDWDTLANTDIDAVILRSSYGGQSLESKNDSKDIKFDEYIENLNRLNIPYGVYHFNTATTTEKAKIQAQNVVAILKESQANPTFPVFVDIETNGGDCDLIEIAKVYISTFITNGYMPGIYANENYWNDYLNTEEFDAYYRWIANYGSDNGNPSAVFSPQNGIEDYMMWQYTSVGVINGITENTVDLNALFDWYLKTDGWKEISGEKYHYSNGYLTYGWLEDNGSWYYFNDNGAMATNKWLKDSKGWCYLGANGYMIKNDWVKDGGKWYHLNANGYMEREKWIEDSIGWVYLGKDGAMLTNSWCKDSKGWCYVGEDGYAVTNCWKKDSIGWIWLDANGSMTKSKWILDGGKWYFLDSNGYMVSNKWMKDSVGWVYLGKDGAMLTNSWCKDSQGWCYVGADGYAVTNCWKKDSIGWIWLDANGSMTKSQWVQDGGKWYYLDANGYMVYNTTVTIGGKKYTFNSSGVWIG